MENLYPGKCHLRKDKRWECVVYLPEDIYGKRKLKHFYGKTKTECRSKAMKFCAEYVPYAPGDASLMTVENFAHVWMDELAGNMAERTKERYQSILRNNIIPTIGNKKLKDVRKIDCQLLVNTWIKEGYSPGTITSMHRCLATLFSVAVHHDYLILNPASGITVPKIVIDNTRLVEFDQNVFLAAAREIAPEMVPLFLFELSTGLRISELVALSWDQIDRRNSVMTIDRTFRTKRHDYTCLPTKSRKARIVPLTKECLRILDEISLSQKKWRMQLGPLYHDHGLVFTKDNGDRLSQAQVSTTFRKCADTAGYTDFVFHDLRHVYAMINIRAGVDFKTIAESMGHSDVSFTMQRYAFVNNEMRQDASQKLDRFLDEYLEKAD